VTPEIEAAVKRVKRAALELRHAKEVLRAELPTEVLDAISYDGPHAQFPAKYAEAIQILTEGKS
jgi:hypothetical protein